MSLGVQIEKRAAQWLARRQELNWTAAEQEQLDAWLAQATANEVAYLRLEYGWRKVARLAALRTPPSVPSPVPRGRARVGAFLQRPIFWSAVATVLLALAILAWRYDPHSYTTAVGGHETIPLADGSRIELNTDTRVRAQVSDTARTVWLDRGEAYFDVVHAASKPFIVYAGPRRIVVLGTRFSVRMEDRRVRVAVAEGRVKVEDLAPNKHAAPIIVTPGGAVMAEGASNLVQPESLEKISQELSWRHGALVFDQTTLADAAAEFNRYNRRKLVVEDAAVAGTRIGGSFEATNVEAFARLLEHGFGLAVVEEDGVIRISR